MMGSNEQKRNVKFLISALTNQPDNCRKQNPSSKANCSPACQKIPHILWTPNYHSSVHNGPILSQINPVHAFSSYFLKIDLNLSPIYAQVYQVASFLQVSPTQPCMYFYFPSH